MEEHEGEIVQVEHHSQLDAARRIITTYRDILADIIPPEGKYYSVRYLTPEGKVKIAVFQTEKEARQFGKGHKGSVISVHLNRTGTRVLATALQASQDTSNFVEADFRQVGDLVVSIYRAPGCTISIFSDKNGIPVRADVAVVIRVGDRVATGFGSALRSETGSPRVGDIGPIAFTRALNRAIQDVTGTPQLPELTGETISIPDGMDGITFMRFLSDIGITLKDALATLGVSSLNDIKDFASAARQLVGVGNG